MALTPLPDPPQTSDPANFATKADALVAALATMVSEINAGQVLTSGTMTTAAQPNITSLGTLTGLTLSGAIVGATSQNVFNTVSTTVNAFGAATAISLGAATGTLTVNNATLAAKAGTFSTTLGVTGASTLPTIYGSSAANGDITIEGTSSATKTTSSVSLQPTGGTVDVGGALNVTGGLSANSNSGNKIGAGAAASGVALTFIPTVTAQNAVAFSDRSVLVVSGGTALSSKLRIGDAGSITLSNGGALANVATLWIDEPNIIPDTGTVTTASTLYIGGAPTEGTSANYALNIASGAVKMGTLAGTGTRNVVVDANGVLSAP